MVKKTRAAPMPLARITCSILVLRSQCVIPDADLAAIYGLQTRVLNQAIKRDIERFPEDFMFRVTREEADFSRSQTVILNLGRDR